MKTTIVPPPASEEQRGHLLKLLRQFSTAMLVTHTGGDVLRARPMAIAETLDEGVIWFITGRDSAKAHEIETDTRVHVTCQEEHSAYLSLSGHASLVDDRAKIKQLWQEPYQVWFPEGPEDPEIILISMKIEDAEYWDNEGWNKVRYLMESAKAYATGTTPDAEDDRQHGFVRLTPLAH